MLLFCQVLLGCVVVLFLIARFVFWKKGSAKLIFDLKNRTKFYEQEEFHTENSLRLACDFVVKNDGTQCTTISDCLVRPQLPFEQYDGVDVRAKIFLKNAPREDDYFEALLLEKKKQFDVRIVLQFHARKNLTIEQAMAHMVDLPLDILYEELGRTVWQVKKIRLDLTAEEISLATRIPLEED